MQCNWCGKSYTNGYGGGYCSRRCYEEGHRRTCKGCGRSFTGSGYSGSGIYSGAGGDWCSEVCYQKNASPAEKKVDAVAAKVVWTIILSIIFPPLLLILYWRQVLFAIRLLYRMLFSKFFWKYVLPGSAILIAVIMYIAHRGEVKACESEMTQYHESATLEVQKKLDAMTKERAVAIEETRRQRLVEAQKRAEEAARQKAELDAAIAAAKAERKREQEAVNVTSLAKTHLPERFERQQLLDVEIQNLRSRLNIYKKKSKASYSEMESDEAYVKLLLERNRLILERRTIEQLIMREYQMHQQKMGVQK